MENILTRLGLSELQSRTYLWMLEHESTAPPVLAKELNLTRTNAYKVLDSLVDIGLATKSDVQKKANYFPEDPSALTSLLAEERNRVLALERNTKDAVSLLRSQFGGRNSAFEVKIHKGKKAVQALYELEATAGQTIHFIKSRFDIPFMGFEAMDYIRRLTHKFGNKRFGITPDTPEAPLNPSIDKRTNLKRTWIHSSQYSAPVEWSVSNNELHITKFADEPSAIQIKDPVVAEAFLQIWRALDENLRANPNYKTLPSKAKRAIA